ncbi:MAG: hypothetical protein JW827_04150 [Spirochaetes bacterium]|nr:hypothetical protein [Spirochaetota bacterium]
MAILPIDIQTIIAQINNVSKAQQNIQHSPINQQHHWGTVIEDQNEQKDHQVNQTTQPDNEDKKVNPDVKKNLKERHERKERKAKKEKGARDEIMFKDPDKGNIIDVKK